MSSTYVGIKKGIPYTFPSLPFSYRTRTRTRTVSKHSVAIAVPKIR